MAGINFSPPERRERRGGSSVKHVMRLGYKLDMNPLVDIAFLLLTFFMFTTVLIEPQEMEMKIPRDLDSVMVSNDLLFNILVDDNGSIYFQHADEVPKVTDLKSLVKIASDHNLDQRYRNRLINVLKVSDKAKYQTFINILDELKITEAIVSEKLKPENIIRKRKFTIVPLSGQDRELLTRIIYIKFQ